MNVFAVYQLCGIFYCPEQQALSWIICVALYSKLPALLVVSLPQCLERVHALQSNVALQYFFLMLLYKTIIIWPETV